MVEIAEARISARSNESSTVTSLAGEGLTSRERDVEASVGDGATSYS